jgi:UDP-sulfoquinovose synthase
MTKVLVLGSEGFIGRALTSYLKDKGFEVRGIDNGMRHRNVCLIGGASLFPLGRISCTAHFDITDYDMLKAFVEDFHPDAIVHLAEQPSAPFSMLNAKQASHTQFNNVVGTMNVLWAIREVDPKIHLIKLGTEGEFPDWLYKDVSVPESPRVTVQYQGKDWEIPTPRYAGSFYHFSKVFDSLNIDYVCRIWGLRATDLNQGIVYGHLRDTRFDYDYYFGTVVHRFVAQAHAGIPLTVYGTGGQTRAFIHLQNSLEAIEGFINHPADEGEFRTVHQMTKTYSVNQVAEMVKNVSGCSINYIPNPRAEMPENHFTFEANKLKDLGLSLQPMDKEIESLYDKMKRNGVYVRPEVVQPKTFWK